MNTYPFIRYTVVVASLALTSWIIVPSVQAADKPSEEKTSAKAKTETGKKSSASAKVKASTPPTSSEAGRSIAASGSAEDSRKACLDRIPKDASAGQRMLAEDSCTRDESKRSPK